MKYKLTYHLRNKKKISVVFTKDELQANSKALQSYFSENREFCAFSTFKDSKFSGWFIRGADITHVTYRKLILGFL